MSHYSSSRDDTLVDDVNSLKTTYTVIQRDLMSLTSTLEKLVTRFEESRKLNWPVVAVLAGLLPLVVAGLGFFVTSYTNSAAAPIHSELLAVSATQRSLAEQIKEISAIQASRSKDLTVLAQVSSTNSEIINRMTTALHGLEEKSAGSAAADVNSQTDRRQINNRLEKLESQVGSEITERRASNAQTRVQLSEVEQQFHSVSNLENLRAAQQERLNAMMYEKINPGSRYPNGTFFPTSLFQGPGGSPSMNFP